MAYFSINRFPGDGVTTQFEINFSGGYIDQAYVKAYIEDDTTLVRTPVPVLPANFVGPFTLNLGVFAPVGSTMVLYRETPKDLPLVNFSGGARMTEANLDKNATQAIHAVAELADQLGITSILVNLGLANDRYDFVATEGQQGFPLPKAYVPGKNVVMVTRNGVRYHDVNVVETDAMTVTLTGVLPNAGDLIMIEVWSPSEGGTGGGGGGGYGEANTASSVGGGTSLYKEKVGVDLRFKSLVSGANIQIINGPETVTITATGGGSGGGSGGPHIVVIGDSMSAQSSMLPEAWPEIFGKNMRAVGADCRVTNIAINGSTAYRALNNSSFGGQTMADFAVSLAPDIIIVMLGANDAIIKVDGRTVGQVQADMTALFNQLRAGLPTTKLVYGSQLMYDNVNFTPGSLKNKGIAPYWHKRKSNGILAGSACSELLDDAVETTLAAALVDWNALDTTVKSLPALDSWFTVKHWKVARLGACGIDGLHLKSEGAQLIAGYVLSGFRNTPALAAMFSSLTTADLSQWQDPDSLFSEFLVASGDGFIPNPSYAALGDFVAGVWGHRLNLRPNTWFLPSGAELKSHPEGGYPFSDKVITHWRIMSARPNTTVQVSLNGAAFGNAGATTDSEGNAQAFVNGTVLPVGTHTLRYKVGDHILGPSTVVVAASPVPYVRARVSGTGGLAKDVFTQSIPWDVKDYDRTNSLVGNTFTAPIDGVYEVAFNLGCQNLPTGSVILALLYVNGVCVSEGDAEWVDQGLGGCSVTDNLYLTAGQQLQMRYYWNTPNAGSASFTNGARNVSTRVSIAYIGA